MRFHKLAESLLRDPYKNYASWMPSDYAQRARDNAAVLSYLRSSQKFFVDDIYGIPNHDKFPAMDNSSGAILVPGGFPRLPFDGWCSFEFQIEGRYSAFVVAGYSSPVMGGNGHTFGHLFGMNHSVGVASGMGTFVFTPDDFRLEVNPYMREFFAKHDMRTTPKSVPERDGMNYCLYSIFTLYRFLELVNCVNVCKTEVTAPRALNKKRGKAGKVPLFSYWTLDIDPSSRSASLPDGGGTHASPRIHLRRGHIKHRKTGDFWWRPCAVGDRKRGVVMKDYRLKGQQ